MAILATALAFSGGTSVDRPIPRGFPGVVPAFFANAGSAAPRRDRLWLARSRPLGHTAPRWARRMYRRSLLALRATVDQHGGAAVAGGRPGWAYVWPRDAAAVAIALSQSGYRREARRIARFLLSLDLDAAARFERTGEPVEGRSAQGDAAGWVAAAAHAAGVKAQVPRSDWRGRADYQEKDGGDYLGNALASDLGSLGIRRMFGSPHGLTRAADDPESGLDAAAAWAVRPFPRPLLFPAVRRTLLRLVAERKSRFGLVPSEDWDGGEDPWTAPTAWTAWALAILARHEGGERARRDHQAALSLLTGLRRAATPLGLLPERVDVRTGLPSSTTPLAWSHAFAILALRAAWR